MLSSSAAVQIVQSCIQRNFGHLSYSCLSIISNQFIHVPFTFGINLAFLLRKLSLTTFSIFRTLFYKTLQITVDKNEISRKVDPYNLEPTAMPHSKSFESPLLFISVFSLNFRSHLNAELCN